MNLEGCGSTVRNTNGALLNDKTLELYLAALRLKSLSQEEQLLRIFIYFQSISSKMGKNMHIDDKILRILLNIKVINFFPIISFLKIVSWPMYPFTRKKCDLD